MYNYLIDPDNRLNNAVRKLEEISNLLEVLKNCDLQDIPAIVRSLRENIGRSKTYLGEYKALVNQKRNGI